MAKKKPDVLIEEKKNHVGHPTKYRPEYDQLLITHMGMGYTFESFAGHPDVRVDRDTIYNWCSLFASFSDAKKVGRSSQLYRDEQTLEMLTTGTLKDGSASTHIFKMKNCHGWKDKSEIVSTNTNMTLEEFLKQQSDKIKD